LMQDRSQREETGLNFSDVFLLQSESPYWLQTRSHFCMRVLCEQCVWKWDS
jgi:hypothetical protein